MNEYTVEGETHRQSTKSCFSFFRGLVLASFFWLHAVVPLYSVRILVDAVRLIRQERHGTLNPEELGCRTLPFKS